MRCIMVIPLALVLAAPVAWGRDEKGKDPPKGEKAAAPQDQLKALQEEQKKASEELVQKFRSATEEKVRNEIRDQYYKMQIDYSAKYVDLAKKNPKDPVAIDALQQSIGIAGMPGSEKVIEQAVEALAKDHAQSDKIKRVCQMFARSSSPAVEKLMLAVMENNKDHETQAEACMALALNFKNRVKETGDENLRKQAEKYFNMVVEKYGDVKAPRGGTLADSAKNQLTTMKNMVSVVVGKAVPDLTGPDMDGKEFKLSDYRGKVVLLDFWAHW
jgi:hypothetical protein